MRNVAAAHDALDRAHEVGELAAVVGHALDAVAAMRDVLDVPSELVVELLQHVVERIVEPGVAFGNEHAATARRRAAACPRRASSRPSFSQRRRRRLCRAGAPAPSPPRRRPSLGAAATPCAARRPTPPVFDRDEARAPSPAPDFACRPPRWPRLRLRADLAVGAPADESAARETAANCSHAVGAATRSSPCVVFFVCHAVSPAPAVPAGPPPARSSSRNATR